MTEEEKYTGFFDTREEYLEHQLSCLRTELADKNKSINMINKEYFTLREMMHKQWYEQPHIHGCNSCDKKNSREVNEVREGGRVLYNKCDDCTQHPVFIEFILDGEMDVENE